MRRNSPVAVDTPSADQDRPAWVKVGIIAVLGFAIGVAWPRLLGVKLGPSAPGTTPATAAATPAPATSAEEPAPAANLAKPAATPARSAAPAAVAPEVHVGRPAVINCKNAENETLKGRECGAAPAGLDAIVTPRLQKLASCGAAEGQSGKLSVVVTVDFTRGGVSHSVGKSSTVGNLDGITGCLKTHFSGVVAKDVPHEHKRYVVAYAATFKAPAEAPKPAAEPAAKSPTSGLPPPGDDDGDAPSPAAKPAADDKPAAVHASGEATIAWEVALVRDVPKTGAIVARLPRGTKVKPGESRGGWYAIQFGDGKQGWVYRGAIGR